MNFQVYGYDAFVSGTNVDHVYVKFDNDITFNCAGGNSGGKALAGTQGSQDIELAKKLNEPMSIPLIIGYAFFQPITIYIPTADAGIIYGVNGVCHTMANRLIVPSGKTVENARGYGVSTSLYGKYGTSVVGSKEIFKFLPEAIKNLLPEALLIERLQDSLTNEWEKRLRELGLFRPILTKSISSNMNKENLSPDEEYKLFIHENLEGDITHEEIEAMVSYLVEDDEDEEKDDQDLDIYENIANRINNKQNRYLHKVNQLIGDERYEKLFSSKVTEQINLVNHEELRVMSENISKSVQEQLDLLDLDNETVITATKN